MYNSNPAHSATEDEQPPTLTTDMGKNNKSDETNENTQLRGTIDVLQDQVLLHYLKFFRSLFIVRSFYQVARLQEAMLSLSDKIVNRGNADASLDAWDDAEELKLVPESQVRVSSTGFIQMIQTRIVFLTFLFALHRIIHW